MAKGKRRSIFNPIPYQQRSRRVRKRMFIRVKNDIRRAAPVLGGRFYSQDYLHGANSWVDVCFLSASRNQVFFNAMLQTARHALADRADSLASERSCAIRPFPPLRFEAGDQPGLRVMVVDPGEREPQAVFDGLTRRQWIVRERTRLIESGEVAVCDSAELDHSYAAGIGLNAVLDVPGITVAVIEAFIDRFRASGERGWCGAPIALKAADIDEREHIASNAIVDPIEHPPEETGAG